MPRHLVAATLIVSLAAVSSIGAEPSKQAQSAACQALQRKIAALDSLPVTGPPGLGWFCDFSTLSTAEYYVVALRSNRAAPYSDLMGWYAVMRRDLAIFEYDINEEKLLPLAKHPDTSPHG